MPTKFCANSSIQFGVIDIFRNPRWRPPPFWIFKWCKFGTFRHVNSVLRELYIKFGSNVCYSHWDQHTYAPDIHLMTSRELTSGFKMATAAILDFQCMWIWPFRMLIVWYLCSVPNLVQISWDRRIMLQTFILIITSRELTSGFDFKYLVMWSPHGRGASFHKIWCTYLYPVRSYWHFFRNSRWRPPPSWVFSICEFGHSGVLIVWYLCSVPTLVKISVIVTEIDAHMLQSFIWWRHAN